MLNPQQDIGALVFCQQNFFPASNQRRAFDDDPLLGAVVMHLQANLCAWANGDALDLVSLTHINAVVSTPRSGNFSVLDCSRDIFCV